MAWVAAAVAGVGAGMKIYQGLHQSHQASQIEKNNIRPTQYVDPLYQQNLNTAQQMATQGMPQAQYNAAMNNINRNQSGGIQALGRSANPGAGLASLVRAGNDATGSLNAQDAAERNRNTLALIQQRGILAGQKQNAWNYNHADKYSENLAKSQALRGAGAQNIAGALNDVGSAGMQLAGMGAFGGGSNETMGQLHNAPDLSARQPSLNGAGFSKPTSIQNPFGLPENTGYFNPDTFRQYPKI